MTGKLSEAGVPALPPWVRLHFDPVRGRHVLLAPERVLFPCPIAVTVLQRLGEGRRLGALIDELTTEFAAPREVIARDVRAMMEDLLARNFLILRRPETVDG